MLISIVSNDPTLLEKILPTTISLIITGIISLIIGIYVEKFKNKLNLLKKRVVYQPIATSSQTPYWGSIKVLYNGRDINHINFVTLELHNDSNHDMDELKVDFSIDNDSQILAANGFIEASTTSLLLSNDYFNYFLDVLNRHEVAQNQLIAGEIERIPVSLESEIRDILSRKSFNVPAINRNDIVKFNFLVENFKGFQPVLSVSTNKKSVIIVDKEDESIEKNKKVLFTSIIGLALFVIVVIMTINQYQTSTAPILIIAGFSLLTYFFGILIYNIIKWFVRYLN